MFSVLPLLRRSHLAEAELSNSGKAAIRATGANILSFEYGKEVVNF
jgi:hypothetical protein